MLSNLLKGSVQTFISCKVWSLDDDHLVLGEAKEQHISIQFTDDKSILALWFVTHYRNDRVHEIAWHGHAVNITVVLRHSLFNPKSCTLLVPIFLVLLSDYSRSWAGVIMDPRLPKVWNGCPTDCHSLVHFITVLAGR